MAKNKTETKAMPKTAGYVNRKTTATLKISCSDLILLSKLAAFIKSPFKDQQTSKIMVSEDRSYYIFINVPNSCIANALLEISPYPLETQQ